MEYEHDSKEIEPENKLNVEPVMQVTASTLKNNKEGLLKRRRQASPSAAGDELKVVIERDNMIVGFLDNVVSDATDESQSGDENCQSFRKCLKRSRDLSPETSKKVLN